MLYEGAIISLISLFLGALLTIRINRSSRREIEREQINNDLHALYLEVEENLIYCSNVKDGSLELLPLETDGYSRFKASKASRQTRGKLLSEIVSCYLKIQNFNKKAFAYEGGLANPHIAKELSSTTKAIASAQYLLCNYLIDKKILPVKNIR